MKIYNRLVLDINTFEVLEEDSFEYDGPIAHCGGGGGETTVTNQVDKEYNARMAAVAEKQQSQADAYFEYWDTVFKPYEMAQIEANKELMPFEVNAQKETLKGISTLAPVETAYRKSFLESETDLIPKRHAVSSKFYEQAMSGVDIRSRMDTASADVAHSLKNMEGSIARSASRMGLDPSSGRFADMIKTSSLERAKGTGFARAAARVSGQDEEFRRLSLGTQMAQGARPT